MQGTLIDDENYPRSDIDVYAVRVARNLIICKEKIFCFDLVFSNYTSEEERRH